MNKHPVNPPCPLSQGTTAVSTSQGPDLRHPASRKARYKFLLCLSCPGHGAKVWSSDAKEASRFNTAGNWSDATAPSAENDYVNAVVGQRLRTPKGAEDHIFLGNSLTLSNGAHMFFTGITVTTAIITVTNLILDDCYLSLDMNSGRTANLNGNIWRRQWLCSVTNVRRSDSQHQLDRRRLGRVQNGPKDYQRNGRRFPEYQQQLFWGGRNARSCYYTAGTCSVALNLLLVTLP